MIKTSEIGTVSDWVRLFLPEATRATSPAELLTELAQVLRQLLRNPGLRLALANDSHTPPQLLRLLARQDGREELCLGLTRNPSTPPDILFSLARSEYLRRALAYNPGAPPILLAALVGDWDAAVRRAVARNPRTPAALLSKLARDPDLWVRQGAALNPSAPPEALRQLAAENKSCLSRAAAHNASTPPDVLVSLAERPVIGEQLAKRPSGVGRRSQRGTLREPEVPTHA